MNYPLSKLTFIFLLLISVIFFGCSSDSDGTDTPDPVVNDEETKKLEVPATYKFERDGKTSVSYSGQVERLDMVAAIKSYLSKGDKGEEVIKEQTLLDAFENKGDNGGGFFSFTSTKQIKNKTFAADVATYESWFQGVAATSADVSAKSTKAVKGTAGSIVRETKKSTILVDAKGREYTQLIEKGLMGALMYNQIFNTYLTNDRIGADVENEKLSDGKNYTAKEHHWDEAYGYIDAPVDFSSGYSGSGAVRFWANYSNVVDGQIKTNDAIMDAFKKGRTAIVNKDDTELSKHVEALYTQLERVAAATAIHYINETIAHLGKSEQGEAFHTLSEAWAFVNAIKYSPKKKITIDQITKILDTDFGDFWDATTDKLNTAKNFLSTSYGLDDVKDKL